MRVLWMATAAVAMALGGCGADGGSGSGFGGSCSSEATHEGEGTFYAADGSGNCSFDPSPGDLLVGAMNHVDYGDSGVCGACAHLKGPKGEVTVRIVDQCPGCAEGDIDLSPEAFGMLADLSAGRVPISWSYVPCDVSGPIVYHFKEGSNEWWTAVQVRNSRYAIGGFAFKDESGSWVDVPRVDYNYFVAEQGMGKGPFSFRVTDVYGNVLEDSGVAFVEAGDSVGVGQFPVCGK